MWRAWLAAWRPGQHAQGGHPVGCCGMRGARPQALQGGVRCLHAHSHPFRPVLLNGPPPHANAVNEREH